MEESASDLKFKPPRASFTPKQISFLCRSTLMFQPSAFWSIRTESCYNTGIVKLNEIQKAAQSQFGKQSERYGRGHILENIEDVQHALSHVQLPRGARALDVATGGGHTGLFLASQGFEVTVSDIAQPMLDRVAQTASERGLKITTAQHPAESFPFPDRAYDLVTCRVAPHQVEGPPRQAAVAARADPAACSHGPPRPDPAWPGRSRG